MRRRIEFVLPGSFFSESMSYDVEERDADDMPSGAFAYRYYELPEVPESTDDYEVYPKRKNVGPWHYPGGSLLRIEDVEAMNDNGRYDILLSNMRGNGWNPIVKTRAGNFVPYEEGDVIE